jgi:pimeloyl-ACP methyl ester carboxylesterase
VLLLTVAAHLHVGPSRQWVELARRWAAAGARVLRFDLSGVGDSGELDGPKAYTERSISDVIDAARAISPDAPARVILFGMCSGAWAASAAGTELAAQAVYLLNPDQWHAADPVVTDGSRPGSTAAASTLRGLLRRGVAVTLVVGPEDERSLDAALRQSERAELLEPAERPSVSQVRFRRIEALDHDLLTRAAGLAVDEQLSPLVLGDCGLSAVPSDS